MSLALLPKRALANGPFVFEFNRDFMTTDQKCISGRNKTRYWKMNCTSSSTCDVKPLAYCSETVVVSCSEPSLLVITDQNARHVTS